MLTDSPGSGQEIRYFPSQRLVKRDGPILELRRNMARVGLGCSATTHRWRKHIRVATCPNPSEICVVTGGRGYVIDVTKPELYENVPVDVVTDCLAETVDDRLLVVAGVTAVAGWSADGLCSRVSDLASDGLRKLSIQRGELYGEAWRAEDGGWTAFRLSLADGSDASTTKRRRFQPR